MIIVRNKGLEKFLIELYTKNANAIYTTELFNDLIELADELNDFKSPLNMQRIDGIKPGYEYYYYLLTLQYEKKQAQEGIKYFYDHINPLIEIDKDLYNNDLIQNYSRITDCKKFEDLKLIKRIYKKGMLHELDEPRIIDDREVYSYGYFSCNMKIIQLEENDEVWMSLLPNELITMKDDMKNIQGRLLCAGLGLGYFPLLIAARKEIEEIVVIESDERIIEFYCRYIKPYFNTEKIKIINGDAIDYCLNLKENSFDSVYIDIYHTVEDGLNCYLKIKSHQISNVKYVYWIEKSFLIYIRRYLIVLLYEDYFSIKVQDDSDMVFKYLSNCLKDYKIKTVEDVKRLTSLEYISQLIKDNPF